MNQRGFATLEVILMVMVIGILASIAVPRFTSVTTSANTAKIQADLSTIDTAIAIYVMENGTTTAPSLGANGTLKDYIQDIGNVKPPTGQAYVNGKAKDIPANATYEITNTSTTDGKTEYRAALTVGGEKCTAGDFTKKES